jgi:hypothetical protein
MISKIFFSRIDIILLHSSTQFCVCSKVSL